MSAKDDLFNRLFMICTSAGFDFSQIKDKIWIALSDYEVTERCTTVALLREDYNEALLKKFLIVKMVKGCTERTIDYYKRSLSFTFGKINKNVDEITSDDIRLYLAKRMSIDGVTKITADNELRCLRTFYNFLFEEGVVKVDPTRKIERIKAEKKPIAIFSELEIEKMRDVKDERIKCMVEMFLSTGCRVFELVSIKIEDIKNNQIRILGKGNKYRVVFLNAKAQIALEKYLALRKDKNPYLFPGSVLNIGGKENIQGKGKTDWWKYPKCVAKDGHMDKGTCGALIRKLGKRNGIENAHPHKFRKTCATMALRRGMPLLQVSQMLGHESIKTTQIYLKLDDDEMENNHKKFVF